MLDGLREGGRMVGIVSDVAELRQRIRAQVRVRKGQGGSHLTVRAHAPLVGRGRPGGTMEGVRPIAWWGGLSRRRRLLVAVLADSDHLRTPRTFTKILAKGPLAGPGGQLIYFAQASNNGTITVGSHGTGNAADKSGSRLSSGGLPPV